MALGAFFAGLVGALATAVQSFVGRVLVALGVGYVSYTGLDVILDAAHDELSARLSGLPALGLQVLGVLQFDTCALILLGAWAARLSIAGLTSGVLTKAVIK